MRPLRLETRARTMKCVNEEYPKRPSPCYCLNLRRASRAITQYYDDVLRACGLTTAQLALLRTLETAETATMSTLAKMLRIDRTTLNRNLKPLTEAGYITVQAGRDSRTREIRLTEAGKNAVAEGWKLWEEAQRAVREYMGETDLEQLKRMLSKIEALVP